MLINQIDFLNEYQCELLLSSIGENKKYKLITLLMLDAGLRVSEVVSLKTSSILYSEQALRIKSLKKKKETYRDIPMTNRIIEALAIYISSLNLPDEIGEYYLFKANNSRGYLSRKSVWAYYKRKKIRNPELFNLHPHALRHTFATRLVKNEVGLLTAKELLGHCSITTTEIYTHIDASELRSGVRAIEFNRNIFQKIIARLKGERKIYLRSNLSRDGVIVGRSTELEKLDRALKLKVNILIKGDQGTGKTKLLEQVRKNKDVKIAWMDDLRSIKPSLLNLALYILNDKEAVKKLLYKDSDIEAKLTRESIPSIVNLLTTITTRHEYTICIDDLTNITPTGIKALENLNKHFHIIGCARFVKVDKISFLTNFEIIQLDNLKREFTLQMIKRHSEDIMNDIEDYELYQNHIWEQTNGNPQFIIEIIDRYRKEHYISNEVVREIRHTAARQEIDFTPILIIMIASLMVLRYWGREIGESSLQLIGGAALVFAIFGRGMYRALRRRYL